MKKAKPAKAAKKSAKKIVKNKPAQKKKIAKQAKPAKKSVTSFFAGLRFEVPANKE